MGRIYYDKDVDLSILKNKTIAVIGYGNQGRAQALNMRDSGLNVILGLRKGGRGWEKAQEAGFNVSPIDKAAEVGDVVIMLIPDEVQPTVYEEKIKHKLEERKALVFASGFNIHYGFIVPPENIDVVLVAPVCPGVLARESYLKGSGPFTMIGVSQDYSGNAKNIALALAKAIGATRVGALESSFAEEVETDLFTEVAGLGLIPKLLLTAYELMVEAGYQPEAAYSQTFYELKFTGDVLFDFGLEAITRWSTTAQYMVLDKAPSLITDEFRNEMKNMLKKVQSGEFAKEWALEEKAGKPVLTSLKKRLFQHPIKEAEKLFVKGGKP